MSGRKAKALRREVKAYYNRGFGPTKYTEVDGARRCLGLRSLYQSLKHRNDNNV